MMWAKKAGSAIVDLGLPLANSKTITRDSLEGSRSSVVGYSILEADSIAAVSGLLKEHPHLHMPNSSIEVFEGMAIPGM